MSDEFTSGEIAAAVKDASPEPASPAAQPEKTPAQSSAAAIEPSGTTQPKKDDYGPVPWERHEVILNNTRRDYEGKLSRLSWAEQLKADEVREALELRELARRNPKALIERFTTQTAEAPQPDLQTEDGRKMFSAEQNAASVRYEVGKAIAQLKAELDPRLKPFEDRAASDARFTADLTAVQKVASLPKAMDYIDDMTKYTAEMNQRRRNGEAIPELSARDVYDAVVLPKLAATEQQIMTRAKEALLSDMNNTSRRANEDVNPGKVPAGSRKADKDKSFQELIGEEFAKAGAA